MNLERGAIVALTGNPHPDTFPHPQRPFYGNSPLMATRFYSGGGANKGSSHGGAETERHEGPCVRQRAIEDLGFRQTDTERIKTFADFVNAIRAEREHLIAEFNNEFGTRVANNPSLSSLHSHAPLLSQCGAKVRRIGRLGQALTEAARDYHKGVGDVDIELTQPLDPLAERWNSAAPVILAGLEGNLITYQRMASSDNAAPAIVYNQMVKGVAKAIPVVESCSQLGISPIYLIKLEREPSPLRYALQDALDQLGCIKSWGFNRFAAAAHFQAKIAGIGLDDLINDLTPHVKSS